MALEEREDKSDYHYHDGEYNQQPAKAVVPAHDRMRKYFSALKFQRAVGLWT